MMLRSACIVALLAFAASVAQADTVHLRTGGTIEGIVTDNGETYIVEGAYGTMEIGKELVVRIDRAETPLSEHKTRAAALSPGDVPGWLLLGQWARGKGLDAPAAQDFQHVLSADPENVAAHEALGHEQHDGRWMTHDEVMTAKGYVQFEGQWMTPQAVEARKQLEEEWATEARLRIEEEVRAGQALELARLEQQRKREEEPQEPPPENPQPWTILIYGSPAPGMQGRGLATFAPGYRPFYRTQYDYRGNTIWKPHYLSGKSSSGKAMTVPGSQVPNAKPPKDPEPAPQPAPQQVTPPPAEPPPVADPTPPAPAEPPPAQPPADPPQQQPPPDPPPQEPPADPPQQQPPPQEQPPEEPPK